MGSTSLVDRLPPAGSRAARFGPRGALAVAGLLAATSGTVRASPARSSEDAPPRTTVATAGPGYEAGRLHRLLFGEDYRALWGTPVRVEILDLEAFAGGLAPVRRVGAGQSKGLALRGADGRAYTFRGIEKDATRGLSSDLQRTIAGRIAQDQVAALHPASAVVANALLGAAGVLHVDARLVVMPDDPRLGEFQRDFAGVLGVIQEFPRAAEGDRPGFAGATEIIDARELLRRLRATSRETVDAPAYLRARLVDLFLGDWDRHLGQWRWARIGDDPRWRPIPEDRDFAFCRFEGLVLAVARNWHPRWVSFGDDYPDMLGLTWQAWPLDRELLSSLERQAWEDVAAELRDRLTDEVIDDAVRRMPAEYLHLDGARLGGALRRRRDDLPRAAARFYRHLAEEVRVTGTDERDVAQVAADGGDLVVTVARADAAGEPEGEPWFRRRFRPGETREVRLDLGAGDDRFTARGRTGVRVRVVGGDGDDLLDDTLAGGTAFADASGANRVLRTPTTTLDARPYAPPPPESETPFLPARDWGRERTYVPWFSASPDAGAFLGGGVRLERFGFRKHPHARSHLLRVGYATGARGFAAQYDADFRRENSGVFVSLAARLTQIEILRFFGFGNETRVEAPEPFYRVRQTRLGLALRLEVPLAPKLALSFGPTVEHASTRLPPGRFVSETRPYGSRPFGQLGVAAEVRLDTRDVPAAARRGVVLAAGGAFHPPVLAVEEPFGELHGEASAHLTAPIPLRPSLALRAGAKRVLGVYPFHEAAFVGGPETVRGFSTQRFAGDAGAWGNAELRLSFGSYFLVLPGEYGVFALADTGRVWLDGERSRSWHTGVGGGLWFAYLQPSNTVTLAVARTAERTGYYVRAGFLF